MDVLSHIYADINQWLVNYRQANSQDDREDLAILFDPQVYHAESPYWPPLEDVHGRL